MALMEKLGGMADAALLPETRFANSAVEVAEARGEDAKRAAASPNAVYATIFLFGLCERKKANESKEKNEEE